MNDEKKQPLFSLKGVIIDVILSIIFFFFMREILVSHVPSQDPITIIIVSCMTSFCMTGVFFIAINMLRVTWVDYNQRQKS
jgi:hypothetical protein